MSFDFVSAYLLRALRWLDRMRLALMQARKWLRRRFCWPEAAQTCLRDARAFRSLAKQDLRCWREAVVAAQEAVSGPVACWREMPAFDWASLDDHSLFDA